MDILPSLKQSDQLSVSEKATLDEVIAHCLDAHKHHRQMITQLTLEGVTALTASEARAKDLKRQGFFQRFWRTLTGKNQCVQAQVDFELAQAQYASYRLLEQFAEQHLLTFELVTAVNNKLNTLTVELDEEITHVYETLKKFFTNLRSELVSIQNQLNHLERNVNLLQWSSTIEYQRYNGVEYVDLSDVEKIVCVANDFFQSTQGNWTTNDLMLLKATLAGLNVPVKENFAAQKFFHEVIKNPTLLKRFFQGIPQEELCRIEIVDSPLLKGLETIQRLKGDESYLVDSILEILQTKGAEGNKGEVLLSLLQHFLFRQANMRIEQELNLFDFILELLVGLRMVSDLSQQPDEAIQQPEEDSHSEASEPEASNSADVEGKLSSLDLRILGIWYVEWYLPRLNYRTGKLEITRKLEEQQYSGLFVIHEGEQKEQQNVVTNILNVTVQQEHSEEILSEEASILVRGDHITIECSNPSRPTWIPDSFELELDRYDDVMLGISKHPRGFRGKITFTKQS